MTEKQKKRVSRVVGVNGSQEEFCRRAKVRFYKFIRNPSAHFCDPLRDTRDGLAMNAPDPSRDFNVARDGVVTSVATKYMPVRSGYKQRIAILVSKVCS